MSNEIVVGITYKEHLKTIRAEQFGYTIEPIETVDTLPNVSVPKKSNKKQGKNNE